MEQTLIEWRLSEIMARHRIKGMDLAKELGISDNSVSSLKKAKTMPRLDGHQLRALCKALNKLTDTPQERIPLSALIVETDDEEEQDENFVFAHNKRRKGKSS